MSDSPIRLGPTGFAEPSPDLKVTLIGLFAATGLQAAVHGLVAAISTPPYWIALGAIGIALAAAAGIDWRRITPLGRAPLFLAATGLVSTPLLWGGPGQGLMLPYLSLLLLGALLFRGALRLAMQGSALFVGAFLAFRLTGQIDWPWLAGLIPVGLVADWAIDRIRARHERSSVERHDQMLQAVQSLTRIQEINDPYTRGHSERAKEIAMRTARRLGMTPEEEQLVGLGAMLHDLGKIVVPPEILHKPGPLTEQEWQVMRMHPSYGASIVGEVESLRPLTPLILHHHERYDGQTDGKHPGYPAGLKGEAIPLGARIIAVVDAFDAMTTDRVYRKGRPAADAVAELRRWVGIQFDPRVVQAFEQVLAEMGDPPQGPLTRGQHGGAMRFAGQLDRPLTRLSSDKHGMRFAKEE